MSEEKYTINEENSLIENKPVNTQIFYVIICCIGIIITGSVQGIVLPLMDVRFKSEYFLIITSTLETLIILFMIMLGFYFCGHKDIFKLKDTNEYFVCGKIKKNELLITLVLAGFFCALMCISKIYASDPLRVSPIIQSTLVSSLVIFSFIFSKLLLNKKTEYNYYYIIPSILTLLCSILMPLIYELLQGNAKGKILWVLCYLFGVICRSLYTVFQEKYFIQSNEFGLINKIKLLFYVNLFAFIICLPFYFLEYIWGKSSEPMKDMLESLITLFTNLEATLIFHGFILSFFVFLAFSTYLNTISSNYIQISCSVVTPIIMIIFTIFPNLVPGIVYPFIISIPALFFSLISAFLWICGEKN